LGNFNVVRKLEERRGTNTGSSNKREIKGFNKFIENLDMEDIPIVGIKYTWYMANGYAKSRLDRVLVTSKWMNKLQGCK